LEEPDKNTEVVVASKQAFRKTSLKESGLLSLWMRARRKI